MNTVISVTDSIAEIERLYQQLPKDTTPKLTEDERRLQDKQIQKMRPYVDSVLRIINFAVNHQKQFSNKEQDDILDLLNMAELYLSQGCALTYVMETVVTLAYLLGKHSKERYGKRV